MPKIELRRPKDNEMCPLFYGGTYTGEIHADKVLKLYHISK